VFISWAKAEELASQYPNTLFYQTEQGSPPAKISDVNWLRGYWQGEVWGGDMEENWSAASAGSMQAAVKFSKNAQVKFYELITLSEYKNSLVLRLKHFSHELQGWEEKDEMMTFNLVKLTQNAAYFDGYTYRLVSPDELHVFVVIDEDGQKVETPFIFHRR